MLAADDRHDILAAERRYVDQKLLDQNFIKLTSTLKDDAPFPFAVRV
jgi:hypothetical protein